MLVALARQDVLYVFLVLFEGAHALVGVGGPAVDELELKQPALIVVSSRRGGPGRRIVRRAAVGGPGPDGPGAVYYDIVVAVQAADLAVGARRSSLITLHTRERNGSLSVIWESLRVELLGGVKITYLNMSPLTARASLSRLSVGDPFEHGA